MKTILPSIAVTLCILFAGAALFAKMSQSRLDDIAEKCKDEHLVTKPSKMGWQNLSTQQRSKKKREFDEWQKKRINLYRDLETFTNLYDRHVDKDGKCRKNECRTLEHLRLKIIEACPASGTSLPSVEAAS